MSLFPSIIIDCGSFSTKAGFSGDDYPVLNIPSIVGKPKLIGKYTYCLKNEDYVGKEAQIFADDLIITHPIYERRIKDFINIELLYKHITDELYKQRNNTEINKIILLISDLVDEKEKDKIKLIMFEKLGLDSILFLSQSVSTLYSTGNIQGLVIDSGEHVTDFCPILEGNVQINYILRYHIGGKHLTEHCTRLLLENENVNIQNYNKLVEIATQIKQCNYNEFSLPDGNLLDIRNIKEQLKEIIFNPCINPSICLSSIKSLKEAYKKIKDTTNYEIDKIIISGGNFLFPDILQRVKKEFLFDNIQNSGEYSSWIGASIFEKIINDNNYTEYWISKKDFEENGH